MAPSRKLWTALHALDGYLTGQSDWLVNYAARHRAGLRVGTAITEGTANFLVNRRMNKSQQMRWSRRAPICCFRFAAPSTMVRLVLATDRNSTQPTIRNRKRRLPPEPPKLATVPHTSHQPIDSFGLPIFARDQDKAFSETIDH